TTGRTHVVTSLSVRIDNLIPYIGKLNEWPACSGNAYSRSGSSNGGCGGGDPRNENLKATFPAGASASNAGTASDYRASSVTPSRIFGFEPVKLGPLPLALAPGDGWVLNVVLTLPGASGTYTLSLGISLDGGAPVYHPVSAILLAPIAHAWTGPACLVPSMQSQIPPATNPPTFYICPNS